MATYETSGTLTTATKTADVAANEATFTVTVSTNTQVDVTIYQDTTGDGTANNTDSITDISSTTYSLSGFEAVTGADYWIEFSLSTTDDTTTPSVDVSTVSGTIVFSGAASLDGTGDIVATGTPSITAASSLAGSGDVVASKTTTHATAASLTGSGDLFASAAVGGINFGVASLDGSGDIVATASETLYKSATPTGSGDVEAAGTPYLSAAADLTGSGDVVGIATIKAGVGTVWKTTDNNALQTTSGVINTK